MFGYSQHSLARSADGPRGRRVHAAAFGRLQPMQRHRAQANEGLVCAEHWTLNSAIFRHDQRLLTAGRTQPRLASLDGSGIPVPKSPPCDPNENAVRAWLSISFDANID